jgi:hypothetical protein
MQARWKLVGYDVEFEVLCGGAICGGAKGRIKPLKESN